MPFVYYMKMNSKETVYLTDSIALRLEEGVTS